jgi:hypothetical protein
MKASVLVLTAAAIGGLGTLAAAQDLVRIEKQVHERRTAQLPPDRFINTEQFKKIYDEVMAGVLFAGLQVLETRAKKPSFTGDARPPR